MGVTTVFNRRCPECGNWFTTDKRGQKYCTTDCDPDYGDSPRTYKGYKDQYTKYYGTEWREIRERVLERAGHECENCGLTNEEHKNTPELFGGGLHVHHKTPAKEFETYEAANDLANLTALCARCHGSEHW